MILKCDCHVNYTFYVEINLSSYPVKCLAVVSAVFGVIAMGAVLSARLSFLA